MPFDRYPEALSPAEALNPFLARKRPIYKSTTYMDLSFGIELEFLLYWRRTPYDEENAPDSLFTREEELSKPFYADGEVGDDIIRKLFRQNGIKLDNEDAGTNLFPSVYLTPRTGWTVKTDSSVVEDPNGPLAPWMTPGYEHCGIEITSPILRDCDAAREHIRQVVRLVTKNCHVRLSPNCGFHCHVGAGTMPVRPFPGALNVRFDSVPHDYITLRRAAMLLWAADPTLAALHPPERQYSQWSDVLRLDSALAKGVPTELCGKLANSSARAAGPERPHVADRVDAERERLPILRPDQPDDDTIFRHSLTGTEMKDRSDEPEVVNKTVMDGVAKILHRARNRRDIATMMGSQLRTNYNFESYRDFSPNPAVPMSYTVEFREAAGSMDPTWITTWVGICTGIFTFCRETDDATLRRVITYLARAEQAARDGREHRYDAITFLRDLDLFTEAAIVEMRLQKDKKLDHWYPCRIDFYPGNCLVQGILDLHASARERWANNPTQDGLSNVLILSENGEPTDEGRSLWKIWNSLRRLPDYARLTAWLAEVLKRDVVSLDDFNRAAAGEAKLVGPGTKGV